MKSKQTRIVLLQPIGPHELGSSISINPMLAAKLIAQGKAKIDTKEPKAEDSKELEPKLEVENEQPEEPKAEKKPKAEKPKADKK